MYFASLLSSSFNLKALESNPILSDRSLLNGQIASSTSEVFSFFITFFFKESYLKSSSTASSSLSSLSESYRTANGSKPFAHWSRIRKVIPLSVKGKHASYQ
jgi:hypothetical protein